MAIALAIAILAAPAAGAAAQDRLDDLPLVVNEEAAAGGARPATGPSLSRVLVSLGATAALIAGLGWACRRLFARQQKGCGGAVSLVSRTLLTPRHQVLVVRAGRRLLLIGDSGSGMNPLCEISDPAEIAEMLGQAPAPADSGPLRAGAFEAALRGAAASYDDGIPGGESEPVDDPPLEAAQGEVRLLIERVRSLAGQMGHPPGEPAASRARV